jgi:hypothetical protein
MKNLANTKNKSKLFLPFNLGPKYRRSMTSVAVGLTRSLWPNRMKHLLHLLGVETQSVYNYDRVQVDHCIHASVNK